MGPWRPVQQVRGLTDGLTQLADTVAAERHRATPALQRRLLYNPQREAMGTKGRSKVDYAAPLAGFPRRATVASRDRPPPGAATMTNIWSLPGAASGLLLVISTCAYVKVSAARHQPPCPTHDACRACCAAGTAS